MPISLGSLRAAAGRKRDRLAKSLDEANQLGLKTAFLCHSHLDAELVEGFVTLLQEEGWRIYVDWQDATMPPTPNSTTAKKIEERIEAASFFLFLATPNSVSSRWCPWEIGFADGVKPRDSILVIPTRDDSGRHYGNEYLQLYRQLDIAKDGTLAVWQPGQDSGGIRARSL